MISSIVPICENFQTLLFYLPDGRCYGKHPFSVVPHIFVSLFLFFCISHVFPVVAHFLLTFSVNFKTTLSGTERVFFLFCFINRVIIALMTMWRFWKVLMEAPIL